MAPAAWETGNTLLRDDNTHQESLLMRLDDVKECLLVMTANDN